MTTTSTGRYPVRIQSDHVVARSIDLIWVCSIDLCPKDVNFLEICGSKKGRGLTNADDDNDDVSMSRHCLHADRMIVFENGNNYCISLELGTMTVTVNGWNGERLKDAHTLG